MNIFILANQVEYMAVEKDSGIKVYNAVIGLKSGRTIKIQHSTRKDAEIFIEKLNHRIYAPGNDMIGVDGLI